MGHKPVLLLTVEIENILNNRHRLFTIFIKLTHIAQLRIYGLGKLMIVKYQFLA